jgi:hypothetical protein
MDFRFFAEGPSVLPDDPHFFGTKTSVLDRHAKECVLILLEVGGKGVLLK